MTIEYFDSSLQEFHTFPGEKKQLWTEFSLHPVLPDM